MTFADLAANDQVFLDTNTLVYHFAPHPTFGPAANQLMARVENQEIQAFTTTHVLGEMAHRLMTIEATAVFGWPSRVVTHLKQQPASIRSLSNFRQSVERLLQSRVQVLPIPPALVAGAAVLSQQVGLLSNDALLIAVMRSLGLTKLASNDVDFDLVPGITR